MPKNWEFKALDLDLKSNGEFVWRNGFFTASEIKLFCKKKYMNF